MVYVIIRISLDKDSKSTVRNTVYAPIFRRHGLTNTKTGTWAGRMNSSAEAFRLVCELTGELETASQNRDNLLDHVWILLDKETDQDIAEQNDEASV